MRSACAPFGRQPDPVGSLAPVVPGSSMNSDDDACHEADLERDRQIAGWRRKARQAGRRKRPRRLYVITLHPDVLGFGEFRQVNPDYVEGMPCVYVGMTIHDPGDRYRQHKAGYRSSRYPRRYGVELAQELMEGFDERNLKEDEREAALAAWLRAQGFGVWQN